MARITIPAYDQVPGDVFVAAGDVVGDIIVDRPDRLATATPGTAGTGLVEGERVLLVLTDDRDSIPWRATYENGYGRYIETDDIEDFVEITWKEA